MSHLFPTELIGSYALPSWLWMAIERAEERGDLGESDIEETLNDAVNMALLDQEKAGVDVFTDGEMRRRDFIQNFYGLMSGLNKISPKRTFGSAGYDQNPRYEVTGNVTAPNGLGIVEELQYMRTLTDKPRKICVPGPITLSLPLILKGGYQDKEALIKDMVKIVNAEMKALVAAGATYLQVDEPRYVTTHEDARKLIAIYNKTRAGVDASVGLHFCFGNFKGRSHDKHDYSYITPNLGNAECDQFNFEFANRENAQIELLKQLPTDCRVGVGVVDVKSYFVETPEQVAASIRLAAEHVAGAAIVRAELAG